MKSFASVAVEDLSEEEAHHELTRLALAILEHDSLYWEEGAPVISDADYNALKQRNSEIEALYPHLILEDSPSLKADLKDAYRSAKTALDVPLVVPSGRFRQVDTIPADQQSPSVTDSLGLEEQPPVALKRPRAVQKGAAGLSDDEIGLIKAMLRRRMRNAEIQFYFNRPDRRVNSGRITEVKTGARGGLIAATADEMLDRFLLNFGTPPVVPAAPQVTIDIPPSPSEEEQIAQLFACDKAGNWRLTGGETDQIECKREVNVRKLSPIIRAMAGMANHKGGVVLLGVEDKSGRVLGLKDDDFEKLDPVKITSAAQAHLQPVPSFTKGVVKLGELCVGYVKVSRCPDRPVIVFNSGDRMDNGAILFRYPAETACIRFGELRSLLDERDARRFRELAAATQRLADIGVGRAAILNTEDGHLDMEGGTRLVLDSALLDQINFIREGHFDEKDGAPTLKVVGEVAAEESAPCGTGRRLITDDDVLRNFLDQETVLEPEEYIRFAVAGSDRAWPPIFYFARQAGLSRADLTTLIEGTATTKRRQRREAMARARGTRSAFERSRGSPGRRLTSLLAGDFAAPSDHKAAEQLAMALQGIPNSDAAPLADLLLLLKQSWTLIVAANRPVALSHVFRAAARLDETYFGRD